MSDILLKSATSKKNSSDVPQTDSVTTPREQESHTISCFFKIDHMIPLGVRNVTSSSASLCEQSTIWTRDQCLKPRRPARPSDRRLRLRAALTTACSWTGSVPGFQRPKNTNIQKQNIHYAFASSILSTRRFFFLAPKYESLFSSTRCDGGGEEIRSSRLPVRLAVSRPVGV